MPLDMFTRSRRSWVPFRAGLVLLVLAACGGGGGADETSMEATPEEVHQDAPVAPTEEEVAAFNPPADSTLTDDQVVAFLRTSLLQYDLVRKEGATLHERTAKMQEREKEGGMLGGLANLADAGKTLAQAGNLLAGSYTQSARTLKYNPAEMEWVRERMAELSGHLMMKPMYEQQAKGVADMRTQAEELRKQAASGGENAAMLNQQADQMMQMASSMDSSSQAQVPAGALSRNLAVLHKARPAVTDEMWAAIGFAGGAQGWMLLSGLGDPNNTEAQKKLDEFRQVYQAALENKAVQTAS